MRTLSKRSPDASPARAAALVCLLALLGQGCAGPVRLLPLPTTAPATAVKTDRAQMQGDLMNFADDLITSVADVYGDIEKRATDPKKMSFVQMQKIEIASSALENAVNVHTFAGLMDTVVLITLMRGGNEDPSVAAALGEDYPAVMNMLTSQQETAWKLAARYLPSDDLLELRAAIRKWRDDNPQQRYVAHVHLIDFLISDSSYQGRSRNPGSIFSLLFIDPLSQLDPAVRELQQSRDTAERMFFYVQRMPLLLSWRVEQQYHRMLAAPQVTQALTDATAFTDSSGKLVDVAAQMAKTLEAFRTDLETERKGAIDQLAQATQAASDAAIDRAYQKLRRAIFLAVGCGFAALVAYRLLFRRSTRWR